MSSSDADGQSEPLRSMDDVSCNRPLVVEVNFLSTLSYAMGSTALEMELPFCCTVKDLACTLQSRLGPGAPKLIVGEKGDLRAMFFVNGKIEHGDWILFNKDKITVQPPLAGG